jgi:hypothetical protein
LCFEKNNLIPFPKWVFANGRSDIPLLINAPSPS